MNDQKYLLHFLSTTDSTHPLQLSPSFNIRVHPTTPPLHPHLLLIFSYPHASRNLGGVKGVGGSRDRCEGEEAFGVARYIQWG